MARDDTGQRSIFVSCLAVWLAIGAIIFLLVPPARAQNVSTISNLFLSPGSEIDFRLFGATSTSDRLNVLNQFNFSSAGTFDIGFARGDAAPLIPGTTFTLVTFGSTNFTNPSAFRAVVSTGSEGTGGLTAISGMFALNNPDAAAGTPGSLTFTLTASASVPEPPGLLLLAVSALLCGAARCRPSRRAYDQR